VAGAGIDEETAHRRRRQPVAVHVVQHCAVLVEGDDVAVGQVVGVLARRLAIRQVDAELAGAGTERAFGGAVAAHAAPGRLAHHRDLVRRLVRAVVFQVVDDRGRIAGHVIAECRLRLAEDRAARRVGRQVLQRLLFLAYDDDVEMRGPVARRRLRHHVPVVARLQVDQLRPRTRRVDEPAARIAGQPQPRLELRADRVRIIAIIERLVVQRAAGYHEVVEPGPRQRGVGPALHRRQVLPIQDRPFGGSHGGISLGPASDSDRSGEGLQPPPHPHAHPQPPSPGAPAWFWALAALAIGLALSFWVSGQQRERAASVRGAAFTKLADESFDAVADSLHACELLLRSVQTVFLASDDVTEEEFATLYENLRPRSEFPSLQALAYAERRPGPDGASDRFITTLVQPREGNERVAGLDLATQPDNLAAVLASADSDRVAMSAPFHLVQAAQPDMAGEGMTLRLPVYSPGPSPTTTAERRERLRGSL